MVSFIVAGLVVAGTAAPPLPAWAHTQWVQAGLSKIFERKYYAKPGFLQADFNGDGKTDVAILVARRTTQSKGIIILHQGQSTPYVVGTGRNTASCIVRGDLSWADHWHIYTQPRTEETTFNPNGDILGSRAVRLKHPTIELTKEEQGGGMIYWNGKRYIWIHQTC